MCGVSYPLYHHPTTLTTTTPCNPQVAAHTQNFSVRLLNGSVTFVIELAFGSVTASQALDGKCVGGREREIGRDVLWIKEVEIWKEM
jgi:hypothetical protein